MTRKGPKQRSQIKNSTLASDLRSGSKENRVHLTVLPEKIVEILELSSPSSSDSESESLSSEIHGIRADGVLLKEILSISLSILQKKKYDTISIVANEKTMFNIFVFYKELHSSVSKTACPSVSSTK
ncbi:hypothetical protein M5689_002881 [Euphorbia peplus]|nr:hypothetical protein M5689_002881 [Euphorbia peplus]